MRILFKVLLIYLVVSFVLLEVYFKIAERFGIMDKPNEWSSHKVVTLRGAGVVFECWYGFNVSSAACCGKALNGLTDASSVRNHSIFRNLCR